MHLAQTRNRIIVSTLQTFYRSFIGRNEFKIQRGQQGAEIFSLVPSAVVKHDNLRNLAEKLQFWQRDLPTPSSLLFILKEWQYFWKQYTSTLQLQLATGKSYRVCKIC